MAIDVEPEQPVVGWAPPATAKRPEWMSQHVGTAILGGVAGTRSVTGSGTRSVGATRTPSGSAT